MKFFKVVITLLQFQSVSYHALPVALSTNAQFSLRDTHALSNQNSSDHKCPSVWFEYNQVTHDCQCIGYLFLTCEGESVYADTRHILTYDSTREIISAVKMRHKYLEGYNLTVRKDGSTGILLPNNISELNSYMCGPLNREHYLCNKCKSGYGPPVTSKSASCANVCYLCNDSMTWIPKDLLLYVSLNFIPLTLFYLLILVFQIRLTSAPMTCFIMCSQLVVLGFYEECGLESAISESVFSQIKFTDKGNTLRTSTKILLTLYGVFNLDFFSYFLPLFCISSRLRPIHVFSLGYITAFYPFLLILLTWFCVELHGRNFRPIVWLWRPFHGCVTQLRRGWNTKSDLIDVFASFFLLSYSKVVYQIMLTFDSEEIISHSLIDGKKSRGYVLSADLSTLTLTRSDGYMIFMVCFSVLLLLLFFILPVFLLFFYPTRILRNLLSKCLSSRLLIFLNIFMEKFHCSYRDGLDDTRDMRSLSGIYFLLRIMIYSAEAVSIVTLKLNPHFVHGFIFSVAALIIALCRPYKRKYMNIMDCILLFHMATFCYIIASTISLSHKPTSFLPMMYVMLAFPFISIFLLAIYRMTYGVFRKCFGQWSPLPQCSACLKRAKVKICGSFTSQNLTLPGTT